MKTAQRKSKPTSQQKPRQIDLLSNKDRTLRPELILVFISTVGIRLFTGGSFYPHLIVKRRQETGEDNSHLVINTCLLSNAPWTWIRVLSPIESTGNFIRLTNWNEAIISFRDQLSINEADQITNGHIRSFIETIWKDKARILDEKEETNKQNVKKVLNQGKFVSLADLKTIRFA